MSSAGWLTAAQAAEYLSLAREALYKRVERGQIPAHRFGRQYRFRTGELDRLMLLHSAPASVAASEEGGGL